VGGGGGPMISKISGSVGIGTMQAGYGGYATAGTGGAGGSINMVNLAASKFVQSVTAGNGGLGSGSANTEGAGGSISNVTVAGDIGNFTANFGTNNPGSLSQMGGLVAGQGGGVGTAGFVNNNGGVTNVTATRIASIVAGYTNGSKTGGYALTDENDVLTISGLHTKVLGADLNFDGVADDTASAPWTLGDTNALVDGIVMVQTGGFTGTHPALITGALVQITGL
jgi:hypothetical protein